jgi:hypothetical protein
MLICVICGSALHARADEPATQPTSQPASVESLLRSVGIEPHDVGIQPNNLALMVGRRPRSELSHLLMCAPLRADGFGRIIGDELVQGAAQHPVDVLAKLSRYNRWVVRRGLVGDPLEKQKAAAQRPGALRDALDSIGWSSATTLPTLDAVPASVQEAAALLILTAREAERWVRRAYTVPSGADEQRQWAQLLRKLREPVKSGAEAEQEEKEHPDPDFDLWHKALVEDFRTESLMVASQDLLLALEAARKRLADDASLPAATFDVRVNTDLGWIVLADGRNNAHRYDGPVLLIIDTGGDDTYANAGANADPQHSISLALDLAGNDAYRADPQTVGSFGAGILGVGILYDLAGDDVYEGARCSQGAAQFGVGVLIDGAGDDVYKSIEGSQGSAVAGHGLLIDRAGNDRYEAYMDAQAFAGPNAAAALIDLAGNDRYIANDTDIRFPSAQNKEHNNSMCQGAGTGWRADYLDGVSINGGVGILVDAAGDDEYTCGVFGQGVGYWYGTGMLIDLAGNDRYTGHWYVQGAAAHNAAGLLFDRGGNDQYTANQNMSQGAGHDLSIGVLIDDRGDDVYLGSALGLGASNAAGIGIFIDKAGDDVYRTPPHSCLGWVNPTPDIRKLFPSYGLFFDLGGHDAYEPRTAGQPGRAGAGDGRTWTTPPDKDALVPYVLGYGFDQ